MPVQSLFDVEESAGAELVDVGTGVAMLLVAGDRGVEKSDEDNPVVDKLEDEPAGELDDEVVKVLAPVNEVAVPLVMAATAADDLKSQSLATKTSV
ncbi:hypothetical protein KCU85_g5630, partial [Aureobasidium melanogenum]